MALKHNILHRDGTSKIYQSPATAGQYLYFTSRGDDIVNGLVGKGDKLIITNPSSLNSVDLTVHFLEDVQLKDAYFFWEGAVRGDTITAEVILPADVPYRHSANKGNADMINGVVDYITTSQVPDDTWVGEYLLFPVDVTLVRFINEFIILGDNQLGTVLESSGVALINKELKLKMTYSNETTVNPNIHISVLIEVYRENTI
jgi:hypothetical protein